MQVYCCCFLYASVAVEPPTCLLFPRITGPIHSEVSWPAIGRGKLGSCDPTYLPRAAATFRFNLSSSRTRRASQCKLTIQSVAAGRSLPRVVPLQHTRQALLSRRADSVHVPFSFQMPDPENVIQGQKVRAFWVDVWIAAGTKPGVYRGRARLTDGSVTQECSIHHICVGRGNSRARCD